MRHLIALFPLLLMIACSDDKSDQGVDTSDSGDTQARDADGDGFASDEDCDDGNSQVHPGATEVCDSVDNDCDGDVDEGVERTWYVDADGDGFGDLNSTVSACDAPDGAVPVGNDCDDADGTAYPGGLELCDGVDNDCDGAVDEDSETVWYADEDGDGFGNPDVSVEGCDAPDSYVLDDTDCDDAHDDAYPGGEELCDGLDNDCDGLYDEDGSFDVETFYQDRDEDGFGDADRPVSACEAPVGYVTDATDCDDLVASTFPGADELCDGADNDCDGVEDDDALDALTWHGDADSDGFGDPAVSVEACEAPDGFVADDTDCDDDEARVYPDADERCDGLDNDCDEEVDEDALDASAWYADADEDGYGDADDGVVSCEAPAGYGADATDCDDTDDAISPAADELCDGVDNDCDGDTDEDSALDASAWDADLDDDGFGDPSRSSVSCEAPAGSVWDNTDCDDLSADVNPDAAEVCDDDDNDCDGETDEDAVDASAWYVDADSDGYGDAAGTLLRACDKPAGYVSDHTDCDDACASCHPGGTEVCDGDDNDCDGARDEAGAYGEADYYADDDSDGFGDQDGVAITTCDAPSGYVLDNTDCDDGAADVNPDETESCDGTDNDCSGDEDGVVTFISAGGTITDASSTWTSGRSGSPKSITASSIGTFNICPGTYYVSITASATSLTLNGVYGPSETTLSGGGAKRTLYSTRALGLEGLTIIDGLTSTGNGGNLYTSSTLTATDVVIQGGSAAKGGNVYCTECSITLDTVTISDGEASGNGGGVYVTTGVLKATSTEIVDNDGDSGANVYLSSSTAAFTDSTISGGLADTYGGGVYITGSSASLSLSGSDITENTAGSSGGGVYAYKSAVTMSSKSNIDNNDSAYLGGGLYLESSASLTCSGSSSATAGVWGNESVGGGGVYMESAASVTSTTCDWTATKDNSLYDIVVSGILWYTYGNNASFTCSSTGCR